MDEFSAKKLGEVAAFARAGLEFTAKAKATLETVFGKAALGQVVEETSRQQAGIMALASTAGVMDRVEDKASKTAGKLNEMAQAYIRDKWDDAAELLEWLGFFEGAAIVHWRLVEGLAEQAGNSELLALAQSGVAMHTQLLTEISDAIKSVGINRATNA